MTRTDRPEAPYGLPLLDPPGDRFDAVFLLAYCYFKAQAGLTKRELADRAGVGLTTITQWFSGKSYFSGEALLGLCKVFGCSRSDFFAEGEELYSKWELQLAQWRNQQQSAEKIAADLREQLSPEKLRQVASLLQD